MFKQFKGSLTNFEDRLKFAKRRGFSDGYAEYFARHIFDEVEPTAKLATWPHHIRTRGAHGDIDESWNLLALTPENHRFLHSQGADAFIKKFWAKPEITRKIKRALNRRL